MVIQVGRAGQVTDNKIVAAVKNDVARVKQTYQGLGLVASFFTMFQGRATTFAIVFTVCGLILAFQGKLTPEYVALVGAIQALIIGHSLKEDWFARRDRPDDKN